MNCPECRRDLQNGQDYPFGKVYVCGICKIIVLKISKSGTSKVDIVMGKDGVMIGSKRDQSVIDPIKDLEKWR